MKIGVMFASSSATDDTAIRELVDVSEEVGIESLWAVEHVFVPATLVSAYPYTDDGQVAGIDTAVLCDPVVWLSYVAGISRTLKLATGIMILPQRNPAYVAKEWATLDRLSGGRAILGVGIGWMAEEMEALGIAFSERAARTDESIEAIRSLWADGPSTHEGRFHRWSEMISLPKPAQTGGVPIVVGGHAPAAARRAARLGDGFFWPGSLTSTIHAPGDDDALVVLLDALREECGRLGRNAADVEVTVGAYRLTPDAVSRFEDLGVARITVGCPRPGDVRRRLEPLMASLAAS